MGSKFKSRAQQPCSDHELNNINNAPWGIIQFIYKVLQVINPSLLIGCGYKIKLRRVGGQVSEGSERERWPILLQSYVISTLDIYGGYFTVEYGHALLEPSQQYGVLQLYYFFRGSESFSSINTWFMYRSSTDCHFLWRPEDSAHHASLRVRTIHSLSFVLLLT